MPRAAVLTQVGSPLEIWDLELEAPRAGEVMVRMGASGICHTDVSGREGTGFPLIPPIVLGHEAAGVIEAVGTGVSHLVPGDHVVLSFVPQCGQCSFCTTDQAYLCEVPTPYLVSGTLLDGTTRFRHGDTPVRQGGFMGSFSEATVVPAIGAVKIPRDVPLTSAALIGCGVLTGTGAAMRTARIQPGDAVVVVGCGGVGLNAVQGAHIAGAERIIAVDRVPSKLEKAALFGATDLVDANATDPVEAVMQLTRRGADVGIEVIGRADTIAQTSAMTRRGGQVVLVGVPPMDVHYPVPVGGMIFSAQHVIGCAYGSADIHRDIPRLIELYQQGKLLLDELISNRITLDQVNDGMDAIHHGEVARTVIEFKP